MNSENSGQNNPKKEENYERANYLLALRQWNITYPVNTGLLIFSALAAAGVLLQSIYIGRALTETQTEFRASQRARIVLGNELGIPMEIKDFGDKTKIVVYLRNDGRVTAHDVMVKIGPEIAPPANTFLYSSMNPPSGRVEIGPTIGSGEPFTAYLDFDRASANLVRNRTKVLRVVGRITYSDEFDKNYCEPIGFLFFHDPDRFEAAFVPNKNAICSPQPPEEDVFSVNAQGDPGVAFRLRVGEAPYYQPPTHQENNE
jgi:hypothetical protein